MHDYPLIICRDLTTYGVSPVSASAGKDICGTFIVVADPMTGEKYCSGADALVAHAVPHEIIFKNAAISVAIKINGRAVVTP